MNGVESKAVDLKWGNRSMAGRQYRRAQVKDAQVQMDDATQLRTNASQLDAWDGGCNREPVRYADREWNRTS